MKAISYNGIPIKLSANFTAKTLQSRREWHDIFKALRGKNLPSKNITCNRRNDKEFIRKQKLKEFSSTKPL